jgi:type IV fimbrial biogenesis protein FimT
VDHETGYLLMTTRTRSGRGFTLIELVVVMAVFAILVVLVAPNLAVWSQNARVRTTADTMQDALRQAQSEAINQNRVVEFVLTATPPAGAFPAAAAANTPVNYWYAATVPWTTGALNSGGVTTASNAPGLIASGILSTADATQVTVSGNEPVICFSPYGRLTAISNDPSASPVVCGASANIVYRVLPAQITANSHELDVQVSLSGQIRMCDPAKSLANGYPDGC